MLLAAVLVRAEDTTSWQQLVSILQYLQSDYPAAAASRSATELEEQRAFAAEALATAHELGEPARRYLPRLESIQQRVREGVDPHGVSRDCADLVETVALEVGLARSPRHTPDLERGRQLYDVACAACHGSDGRAKVEIASTMEPPPISLLDPERMDALNPYRVFNELSFGITGTAMPSYSTLDEKDRWDLAFFTLAFRQPECTQGPKSASLEQLAVSSDPQLAELFGAKEVPCLRRKLPSQKEGESLAVARSEIERALQLYANGKVGVARSAILNAYLAGIEPAEPMLRLHNRQLLTQLEQSFQRTRTAIESKDPQAPSEGRRLLALVERAREVPQAASDFWSVFWLALLVIVREGFEASVIIAALLAALHKLSQRHQQRVVHAGWILAVALGVLAFVFARHLIQGADRELLEGVTALIAVGLLVYASLWLNARANMRRFMGKLRDRLQNAAGNSGAFGLFTVSFTAMLRESFETAVFIQGLSVDSPSGAAWGALAGGAVLVGLVVFVHRVGYRLPMKRLFNASTVLLLATAVILLGKGIHAIQTVGVLPFRPIGGFQLEALGIYFDAYSLGAQVFLALAPLVWATIGRRPQPDRLQTNEGSHGLQAK